MSATSIIIGCYMLVLILSAAVGVWKPRKSPFRAQLCRTPECIDKARDYAANQNRKVSPCENFFEFCCGSWQKNHPGPQYIPEWNVRKYLVQKSNAALREIFETRRFKAEESKYILAKLVYDTCARIPELPKLTPNQLVDHISKIGRHPFVDLWTLHDNYLQLTGESALFGFRLLACDEGNNNPVLVITEGLSAYGSIVHHNVWDQDEEKGYLNFLQSMIKVLKLPITTPTIQELAVKVFEFRRSLNELIVSSKRYQAAQLEPKSPRQIGEWFKQSTLELKETARINWVSIGNILLKYPKHEAKKLIAFRRPRFILELAQLLSASSAQVIASHIEIYFIERHLQMNENLLKLLDAATGDVYLNTRYTRLSLEKRWQMCLKQHNMKDVLGKLLSEVWVPEFLRGMIRTIIHRIQKAIAEQMRLSSWLKPDTAQSTMSLIKQFDEWIGYPPWYINKSKIPQVFDLDTFPHTAIDLNAKHIIIDAALLRPPLFQPTLPQMYNIAALGSAIGHEFYHVIYDCGSYFDRQQKKIIEWWPVMMRVQCISRKQCFIRQYTDITNQEFKYHYKAKVQADTARTFVEDYADMMGLEAAHVAYLDMLSNEPETCRTLPGFEDYTCDQMFFIAFANTMCGYASKKVAMMHAASLDYSIPSVRVNGAVMNSKAFAKAFYCQPWMEMIPPKRCNLWL